jgi:hypothetical protein
MQKHFRIGILPLRPRPHSDKQTPIPEFVSGFTEVISLIGGIHESGARLV